MKREASLESLWLKGAAYVAPARLVSSGVRACTHLAHISVEGQLQTAYVKAFPAPAGNCLFNEAVGGAIARVSAIGAPSGGLIWLNASLLGNMFPGVVFHQSNGHVACWASLPVSTGYGLAEVGLADSVGKALAEIRRHLLAWGGFAGCAAFDAWVANTDRHANNLLLAGGGRLIPIDHSDCFGGWNWLPDDFEQPNAWYTNKLLDVIFDPADRLPLPVKAGVIAAAERLSTVFKNSEAELASFAPWLGDPSGLHWLRWLEERSTLVVDMLRDRVRMVL
jgi:hypothetical protein